MRPRPCVRQLTVSLGWMGKDKRAAASLCVPASSQHYTCQTEWQHHTHTPTHTHTHWERKHMRTLIHSNRTQAEIHKHTPTFLCVWSCDDDVIKIEQEDNVTCHHKHPKLSCVNPLTTLHLFINTTMPYMSALVFVSVCVRERAGIIPVANRCSQHTQINSNCRDMTVRSGWTEGCLYSAVSGHLSTVWLPCCWLRECLVIKLWYSLH